MISDQPRHISNSGPLLSTSAQENLLTRTLAVVQVAGHAGPLAGGAGKGALPTRLRGLRQVRSREETKAGSEIPRFRGMGHKPTQSASQGACMSRPARSSREAQHSVVRPGQRGSFEPWTQSREGR